MTDIALHVSRLDLEDGNIIVLRTRANLTVEQARRYQDEVMALARSHGFRQVSVLVLDNCSDFSIERPGTYVAGDAEALPALMTSAVAGHPMQHQASRTPIISC